MFPNLTSKLSWIASARETFAYAADQYEYETFLQMKPSYFGRERLTHLMDSARSLSFDKDISHRRRAGHSISRRFFYEQITSLAEMRAIDAAL